MQKLALCGFSAGLIIIASILGHAPCSLLFSIQGLVIVPSYILAEDFGQENDEMAKTRFEIPAWPVLLKLKTSGIKLSSLWLYIKVRNDSQLQSSARFGVTNLEQCVCPTHYPKCEIFSFYGSMGGSGRRLPLIQLGTGPRSLKRRFLLQSSSFTNFLKKNSTKK